MHESSPSSLFDNPDLAAEELAAHLLVTPTALDSLTLRAATKVVTYMHPRVIPSGTVFIREGEAQNTGEMMLVLEGDITIENDMSGPDQRMVVNVVGPGNIIGEMGLLDGEPRSATCTAVTPVVVAVLTRAALIRLMRDDSTVAVQLLLALSTRMSQRLRETSRKLRTFSQMNKAMQEEMQVVMSSRVGLHQQKKPSSEGISIEENK